MLVLSTMGIVTRWMGESWLWVDPLARHLVLVCAFLGSIVAVGRKNHIRIDVLAKPMEAAPKNVQHGVEAIVVAASAVVTAGLAWSAYDFYKVEQEFSSEAFLGLSSHHLVAILPIGMALLAMRWLLGLWPAKRES
jgi:TRAP-type C4-dicarboxylate transport system permease small subunit